MTETKGSILLIGLLDIYKSAIVSSLATLELETCVASTGEEVTTALTEHKIKAVIVGSDGASWPQLNDLPDQTPVIGFNLKNEIIQTPIRDRNWIAININDPVRKLPDTLRNKLGLSEQEASDTINST